MCRHAVRWSLFVVTRIEWRMIYWLIRSSVSLHVGRSFSRPSALSACEGCSRSVNTRCAGQWSQVQTDLSLLGEPLDDERFKVGAVDSGLPEGSGIAVLLPIVMPVSLLVGAVPEHGHLHTDVMS